MGSFLMSARKKFVIQSLCRIDQAGVGRLMQTAIRRSVKPRGLKLGICSTLVMPPIAFCAVALDYVSYRHRVCLSPD